MGGCGYLFIYYSVIHSYSDFQLLDMEGIIKPSNGSDQYDFYTNVSNPLNSDIALDTSPYLKKIFEPSPLNRVIKQYGSGEYWYSNEKSAHFWEEVNWSW